MMQLEDEHECSNDLQSQISQITPHISTPPPCLKVDVPPFSGDHSTAEDFICIATMALTLTGTTDVVMQIAFILAHLCGETTLAWALGEQGKLADRVHGSWEEFIT
jgi:hypothetical protein